MEQIALEELLADIRRRLADASRMLGAGADDRYVLRDLLKRHGWVYRP